jgi:hypothetical protein
MVTKTAYTRCPKCKAKFNYVEAEEEKVGSKELWSDGFYITPTREDVLKFAKCPACNTYFWLNKNSIAEPPDSAATIKIKNSLLLDNIGRMEIDFVSAAINSDLPNSTKKEIYLRLKLWHTINHVLRKYDAQGLFNKLKHQLFESSDYKNSLKLYDYKIPLKLSNLIRLTNLLKKDEKGSSSYLLFAEIYREIGDFGKAMVYCHKAEKSPQVDADRISLLKKNIISKNKIAYKA